ncbi:hypothetical protein HYC85_015728 [Camellia sinensis]|uniref:Wall-associated receptor kinase galacturonan-binding domain-containing protein n=1 Tax=Camellia sinensis TaxID=4442 RepID=A0A7J7GXV6_CAMSI|nr:hypothetical protein HYC85_015728 [Camellia sinensis]
MTSQTDSLIFLPTILLFLIASTTLINHTQSQTQEQSSNYDLCPPFNCSNITFSFPFSPFSSFGSAQFVCGLPGFQITCDHSSSIPSSIEFSGRHYQVKQLFLSDLLVTVVDHTLMNEIKLGSCTSLENLTNSISNGTVGGGAALALPVGGVNLTVFKCPNVLPSRFFNEVVGDYSCKDGNYWAYIRGGSTRRPVGPQEMPIGCEHVSLPVSGASLPLLNNITNGSGDGSQMLLAKVLSIATGSICALLAVVLLLMFKYKRRIARIFKPSYFGKNQTTGDERKAKEFIKNYQSTLLTNYSYNDIKKMTNNFKEKLGEGGYGNVFKGKLPPDGRFIAVKMLMDYRDNSQNFLSEITSIEMVGAKTHAQPEANTSSEAQFSGWIYDKLMIGEERDNMELEDFAVGEEVYIARKMLKVGLWGVRGSVWGGLRFDLDSSASMQFGKKVNPQPSAMRFAVCEDRVRGYAGGCGRFAD